MPKKMRIEFVSAGFKQLLDSSGVRYLVYGAGDKMARLAGEGFVCNHGQGSFGGGRPVAWVGGADSDAWEREATDKVLTRAKNSMRC